MRTFNLNVYLLPKNICVNNSSGVDDISPKILKLKSQIISASLTFLINKSIETSCCHDKL